MAREFQVTLDLPPYGLSPNEGGHWAAVAKARKSYRHESCWMATAAYMPGKPPRFDKATIHLKFYYAAKRRRDMDNAVASFKSAQDGLVDAGVMKDDSGLRIGEVELMVAEKGTKPRVEVLVVERLPDTPSSPPSPQT